MWWCCWSPCSFAPRTKMYAMPTTIICHASDIHTIFC
jgi:hypothetical protein